MNSSKRTEIFEAKLPPQAIEFEEAVLGACMLTSDALDRISYLKVEHFYLDKHQYVYECILDLSNKSQPIDMLTVVEKLRSKSYLDNVGGPYFIAQLTSKVSSAAHIEHHAAVIYEKYMLRNIISATGEAMRLAYLDEAPSPTEIQNTLMAQLDSTAVSSGREPSSFNQVAKDVIKVMQEQADQGVSLSGIPTGFTHIDYVLHGLRKTDMIILAGRPGAGKCLGLGTKVIMYDGSIKRVEDIKVGDILMGDDSTPRNVLSVNSGQEMMYNIVQNKGITYRVNESHILSVMASRNQALSKHGDIIDIPLREYLAKTKKFQNNWKGYIAPIEFPEKPITIPPYLLGIWLGDGTSAKPEITCPDKEIYQYLKEYCNQNGYRLKEYRPQNKCCSFCIVSKDMKSKNFVSELRNINVLNNKHIPDNYLVNSRENRLELLAGLLDTDGHYDGAGCYEITQKSKNLATQIKYLCNTLGFRAVMSEKIATIKSIGFKGTYYRVSIVGDTYTIPCKVQRKKSPFKKRAIDHRLTGIKVIKDKVDTYYGFTLDGNSRFLLEDCTVTHNTAIALAFVKNVALQGKKVGVFSIEMNAAQLVTRLLASETGIDSSSFQRPKYMSEAAWMKIYSANIDLPIIIDDTPGLSIQEFKRKARKMVKQGVEFIAIDYLQLMRGEAKEKRHEELGTISRGIKITAKELNIPILALAQLSREVEKRGKNSSPILSDLKGSGDIEQDADSVIFLDNNEDDPINERFDEGVIVEEIIIAKNRHGATGKTSLLWNKKTNTFTSLE